MSLASCHCSTPRPWKEPPDYMGYHGGDGPLLTILARQSRCVPPTDGPHPEPEAGADVPCGFLRTTGCLQNHSVEGSLMSSVSPASSTRRRERIGSRAGTAAR